MSATEADAGAPSPGLAALAVDAAGLELGAQPGAAMAPDPAAQAQAEARELVQVVASLALPVLAWKWGDDLAAVYGPREQDRIADALGQVAHKRGWSISGAVGEWGPELALVAALAGPALPVLMARAKAAKHEPGSPDEPQPAQTAPRGDPEPTEPDTDGRIR